MKKAKRNKQTNLEKEIDNVLSKMATTEPNTPEYTAMAKNLEVLYKAKSGEKDRRISADTIAIVAANLLGIVLILNHEKASVVTSKALGFVLRGRV